MMTQEERFEKAFEICVDVKKVELNGPVESRIYDSLINDVSILATMFPGEDPLTLTKEETRTIVEEMMKKAGAARFEDPRLAKLDELGKKVALEWWEKLGTKFLQLPLRQFFEVQKHLSPKVFDKAEALGLSCTPIVRREEVTVLDAAQKLDLFRREKARLAVFKQAVVHNPRRGLEGVFFYGQNEAGHPASIDLTLFPPLLTSEGQGDEGEGPEMVVEKFNSLDLPVKANS